MNEYKITKTLRQMFVNIRGFHAVIRDRNHSFTNKERPDIVITRKTLITDTVPQDDGHSENSRKWLGDADITRVEDPDCLNRSCYSR